MDWITLPHLSLILLFSGFLVFFSTNVNRVGGDSIDEIERCSIDATYDEVVRILNTNTRFRITGTQTSIGVSSGDPH